MRRLLQPRRLGAEARRPARLLHHAAGDGRPVRADGAAALAPGDGDDAQAAGARPPGGASSGQLPLGGTDRSALAARRRPAQVGGGAGGGSTVRGRPVRRPPRADKSQTQLSRRKSCPVSGPLPDRSTPQQVKAGQKQRDRRPQTPPGDGPRACPPATLDETDGCVERGRQPRPGCGTASPCCDFTCPPSATKRTPCPRAPPDRPTGPARPAASGHRPLPQLFPQPRALLGGRWPALPMAWRLTHAYGSSTAPRQGLDRAWGHAPCWPVPPQGPGIRACRAAVRPFCHTVGISVYRPRPPASGAATPPTASRRQDKAALKNQGRERSSCRARTGGLPRRCRPGVSPRRGGSRRRAGCRWQGRTSRSWARRRQVRSRRSRGVV
jgi:hypothetical protein